MRSILYSLTTGRPFFHNSLLLIMLIHLKVSPFFAWWTPVLQYPAQISSFLTSTRKVRDASSLLPIFGPSIYNHMDHSLSLSVLQWVKISLKMGLCITHFSFSVLSIRHGVLSGCQPLICRMTSFTLGSTLFQPGRYVFFIFRPWADFLFVMVAFLQGAWGSNGITDIYCVFLGWPGFYRSPELLWRCASLQHWAICILEHLRAQKKKKKADQLFRMAWIRGDWEELDRGHRPSSHTDLERIILVPGDQQTCDQEKGA